MPSQFITIKIDEKSLSGERAFYLGKNELFIDCHVSICKKKDNNYKYTCYVVTRRGSKNKFTNEYFWSSKERVKELNVYNMKKEFAELKELIKMIVKIIFELKGKGMIENVYHLGPNEKSEHLGDVMDIPCIKRDFKIILENIFCNDIVEKNENNTV